MELTKECLDEIILAAWKVGNGSLTIVIQVRPEDSRYFDLKPGYETRRRITDSFWDLAVAVVSRALADLGKDRAAIRTSDHVRDEAMAWINGPECEAFCYVLDMDNRAIQERGAALYRRFLEKAENSKAGKRG
jgi:hypothetical protein